MIQPYAHVGQGEHVQAIAGRYWFSHFVFQDQWKTQPTGQQPCNLSTCSLPVTTVDYCLVRPGSRGQPRCINLWISRRKADTGQASCQRQGHYATLLRGPLRSILCLTHHDGDSLCSGCISTMSKAVQSSARFNQLLIAQALIRSRSVCAQGTGPSHRLV